MGTGSEGSRQKMLVIGGGVLVIVLALTTMKSFSSKSPWDKITGQMETMMKKGDYHGALKTARERLRMAEENFEEGAPQITDSYHDVGAALAADGNYAEAKQWVLRSINKEMAARGDKGPTLPEKLVTLAELSHAAGNSVDAMRYGAKATDLFDTHPHAHKTREEVRAFAITSTAALDQKECDRALELTDRAFKLVDRLGKEPDLLQSLNATAGRAEFCLNRPEKAEPYIKDAIAFAKKEKKGMDPELPALTSLEGDILCSMGKCKQGAKFHADAVKLSKKLYGEDDARTVAFQARAEESSASKGKKKSKKEDSFEEASDDSSRASLPADLTHFENF